MHTALALLAILAGWWAALELVCYATGMHELKIAGVAALTACLPYLPELVALLAFPAPVANVLCAVYGAVLYAMVPKAKQEQGK